MSNISLVRRIEQAITNYRNGETDRSELISAVEENVKALEMMPYHMIKEIEEIEYQLTVAQFVDEDEFLPNEEEALNCLEKWVSKVPSALSHID